MPATIVSSTSWAYFDTSAIVKRYVDEPGRRQVMRLMRQHACVTSTLALVELRGAFRRRVSDGMLDAHRVPAMLERLRADRSYWTLIEIGTDVLATAEDIVAVHPLRALDAIHVASARLFASRLTGPPVPFISSDSRQTDVAAALGMSIEHV